MSFAFHLQITHVFQFLQSSIMYKALSDLRLLLSSVATRQIILAPLTKDYISGPVVNHIHSATLLSLKMWVYLAL